MIRATYFDLVLSIYFVLFSSHNMLNRGVTCPRRHINWPGDRLRADADCPCAHLPHSSTRCNLSVQALLNPNRRCISRPMYACEDTHEFRQGWGVVILYARQVATNKSAGGSHRPARFCRSEDRCPLLLFLLCQILYMFHWIVLNACCPVCRLHQLPIMWLLVQYTMYNNTKGNEACRQ